MRYSRLRTLVATAAAAALVLTACSSDTDEPTDDATDATTTAEATEAAPTGAAETTAAATEEASGDPISVAVLTSSSGPLGAYGTQYIDGFEAGLAYATDGTNAVDGRPIEYEIIDDGGTPETAISAATEIVGEGTTIVAGTVVSGVAAQLAPFADENDILYISGPAATDAITGINDNTFRSGRQSWQDVTTAAALVDDVANATIVVFAQDNAFGQANTAAVEAVLGSQGATIEPVLVPDSATEFTPFAQQVLDVAPDLVFVAWAGETSGAMWQAMDQQGVLTDTAVATGLADRATWPSLGAAGTNLNMLAHYFPTAPDNEVNQYLVDNVEAPDLFTPDGFVAAQMIVQAVSEGSPEDVGSMIAALEGWSFEAPKGSQTVRASDHAMLQPMFTASFETMDPDPANIEIALLDTLTAEDTAPPESAN
jgi:branched-chain amino acid transport system substrate-binding protein